YPFGHVRSLASLSVWPSGPTRDVSFALDRTQCCIGQEMATAPLRSTHQSRDGTSTVRPPEPGQYSVEIGSPIVRGLALAPEDSGKLGVGEPVDTRAAKARDAQCFGRVRALRPTSEFPKQQELSNPGLVRE